MKLFSIMKDGGGESTVTGYWLIEWKLLFSIVLLEFGNGSREAYHSHAFNCFSWVISGKLKEQHLGGSFNYILPSFMPFMTYRDTFHKVSSEGTTWVLSFRGPWSKYWKEYLPKEDKFLKLSSGRKVESI